MFISGLCLLYILLQVTEYMFGLHWKEYTVGVIFLALVICISCFINSLVISGFIWLFVTLIEYRNYLVYFKK
jgi:hypothetical protein